MANYASAEDDAHSYAADGGGPAEDPSEPGECVEQAGVVFAGGGLSVPQHHERTKTDQNRIGAAAIQRYQRLPHGCVYGAIGRS